MSVCYGKAIHAAILPQLGQVPLYNAINFNYGTADAPSQIPTYPINSTAIQAQVNGFLCPSDPNGPVNLASGTASANNCYFGSIGATSDTLGSFGSGAPSLATVPTTGLFAFQQAKAINQITDGTSNTVAFAEATVGSSSAAPRQKLLGLTGVAMPTGAAGAIQYNVFNSPAGVAAGFAACNAVWTAGTKNPDKQRGDAWATGGMAMTLFNTVAPPNAYNDTWAYCGKDGSGTMASFSNADSYHSGGVNVLMADGSVKFAKDSINRLTWWGLGTIAGGEVISSDSY